MVGIVLCCVLGGLMVARCPSLTGVPENPTISSELRTVWKSKSLMVRLCERKIKRPELCVNEDLRYLTVQTNSLIITFTSLNLILYMKVYTVDSLFYAST